MKRIFILFGLITFFSCNNDQSDKTSIQAKAFDFVIEGTVNIEGNPKTLEPFIDLVNDTVELALYIPSRGMDARLKTTVENGFYRFTDTASTVEKAVIYFEKDIVKQSDFLSSLPLFVEPDTLRMNLKISSRKLPDGKTSFNFVMPEIITESNTKKLFEYYMMAPDINYTITFDSIMNDSLHRYIYPSIKNKILHFLDSIFKTDNAYPASKLSLLEYIFDDQGPFDPQHLSNREKQQISGLFYKIDTSFNNTPQYRKIAKYIERFNKNSALAFHDFTLPNLNGKDIRLSDVVKKHRYTVLYFWWSGCRPCRAFNQGMTPEKYARLKEKNIEIVSVNTDKSKSLWENINQTDSVVWTSLYAGAVSGVPIDYNVKAYPTKIVFDSKFNIIPFKFNTADELLKLTDE